MKPTRTMARLVLALALGLWLLAMCEAEISVHISCRYRGVYHVERNGRYKMKREEAMQLCDALNSTLANMTQMENAKAAGFETCRYGWIEDNIVIPRIQPNPICAANNVGVFILVSNLNVTDRYDAFCYNASETREKVCDKVILPDNYRFAMPIAHPSSQDPQQPGGRDSAQLDKYGSDHYPSHDDSHHSEGSSDQGADEDATESPETEDSQVPPLHPGFGYDTTVAPGEFPVDRTGENSTDATDPDGFPPGIIPINGAHESTKAPHAGDSHHGPDKSPGQGGEDETTDAPHPDDTHDGHYAGRYPGEGDDQDTTDAPHPDDTHDGHYAGGFPGEGDDRDTTDEPRPGDSDHGYGVGESPGTGVEDTTDGTDSDHSHDGHPPGGSPGHDRDDAATNSPQPDDSDHGHQPGGSHDHGPLDTTDDSLSDGSRDSASDSVTDKPGQPGRHPSHDFAEGPYQPGSDTVTDTSSPGDSHFGAGLDVITDSASAFLPPHINIPGATALTGLDLSNFVGPSAATEKSPSGGSHKPKPQPGGQGENDSGNSIPQTDPTPGDDEAHTVGEDDSDSFAGGPAPDEGYDSDTTTDEDLPDSSRDLENKEEGTENPEVAIPKLNDAHPDGETGSEATTGGDRVRDRGSDGSSDNGSNDGESDRSATGGSLATKPPSVKRQQRVPDWLIVVVALVSLSLILAVCIAVNNRQVCGHKKKLVINGNGSALEEGQSGEMNGDPGKSQEMVNLMNKEQRSNAGAPQDPLLNSESGRNQQNIDMKIGV